MRVVFRQWRGLRRKSGKQMILLSDIMSCSAAKNVCFGRLIPVILLLALAGGVLCAQTPEHRPSEQKSENASGHDLLVISGTSPEGSLRRGGMELSDRQFLFGRPRGDRQHSPNTSHRKDGQTSGDYFGGHIQQHTTTSTFASDWEHVFQCPSRKYRRCRPVRTCGPDPENLGQMRLRLTSS